MLAGRVVGGALKWLAAMVQGRGLGFMFLRHLRRTRVLMHVVDAAEVDPVADYRTVRPPTAVPRFRLAALTGMGICQSLVKSPHSHCRQCCRDSTALSCR